MVGAGRAAEEQAHRVAFVAEGGLDTNKDVTKALTKDQQVLTIGVEMARGRAPVFLEALGIGGKAFVFAHGHAVGNVQLGASVLGLSIMDDGFHEGFGGVGQVLNVVAVALHCFENTEDRAENIEVGSRTDVTFVGWEAEDGDR